MIRSLRSEFLKLVTIRTFLWIALADVALVVVTALSVAASGGDAIQSATDDRSVAQISGIAVLFALVGGIILMAAESTHGTITQTLLVTPVRERVLGAKAVIGALVGGALVLGSEALVLAITVPSAAGLSVHNARPTLLGCFLAALLAGALGVGLGAIVRGQGAGIGISLLWLLIGENVMPLVSEEGARYAPGRTFAALASGSRGGSDVIPGMTVGGVAAAAWTAAFVLVGAVVLLRRDV